MKIRLIIRKEGDRYIAELGVGWWIASGKSPDEALKRVKDKYFKDQSRRWTYIVTS